MALRVLVVDRAATTRDTVAELLGDHASDVAWATREGASAQLRAAVTSGSPFDVVLLEAEPAPTAGLVRELASLGGGARVVLVASGEGAHALASKCGAADVVARPLAAAELAVRGARAVPAHTRADKRRPRESDVLIRTGAW